MDEPELNDRIIRRLAAAASVSDIVMEVCERTGLSWREAEALVERVRVGRSEEVARRQLPILLPLAALSMIGGVVLLLGAVYPAISPWLAGVAGGGAAQAIGDGLTSTFSWVEPSTIQMIFLGAALLVGGTWGLWKAVRDT
jgi:hypothetical protein